MLTTLLECQPSHLHSADYTDAASIRTSLTVRMCYRLVLKGAYCGVAVAVGRVMPPSSSSYKSIFGMTAKQHAAAMNARGVVTNKGKPRRASASRGKTREKSSPLLESQVAASASGLPCYISCHALLSSFSSTHS